MRFITAALLGCAIALPLTWATAKEAPKNKDELACEKTEQAEKYMSEKSFFQLFTMKNEEGLNEAVWISGTSAIITATAGENTCILALMNDVTYNPDTLQGLMKAYETLKGKQKDI